MCVLLQVQILLFYYFFVILDFIPSIYNELYVLTIKTWECRKNRGDNQFHILISCSAFPPQWIICSHPSPISACVWGWGCLFGGGERMSPWSFFHSFKQAPRLITLISFHLLCLWQESSQLVICFSIFTIFNGQMF